MRVIDVIDDQPPDVVVPKLCLGEVWRYRCFCHFAKTYPRRSSSCALKRSLGAWGGIGGALYGPAFWRAATSDALQRVQNNDEGVHGLRCLSVVLDPCDLRLTFRGIPESASNGARRFLTLVSVCSSNSFRRRPNCAYMVSKLATGADRLSSASHTVSSALSNR